jgi:putative restriction endonuclease
VTEEQQRRSFMLSQLRASGLGPYSPAVIRDLRIYGGAAGIWVDRATTSVTTDDPIGAAVSVNHTGEHYPDDLSDTGLIYHYPVTRRPGLTDSNEIDATKRTRDLGLPLFVLLKNDDDDTKRDVRIGWVTDWDDVAREFLIIFAESAPLIVDRLRAEDPFVLKDEKNHQRKASSFWARPNQQRFRFDVLKAYQSQCVVCSVSRPDLLTAAHICPKSDGGSDDWRNGLALCATHHTAFDRGLFGFDSGSLEVVMKVGVIKEQIGISRGTEAFKANRPHVDALRHHMSRFDLGSSSAVREDENIATE